MTSPCQDCAERRLVCHDYCPAYLAYNAECVAARKQNMYESIFRSYVIERRVRRDLAAKIRRK